MLQRLKDKLFWKAQFDSQWESAIYFIGRFGSLGTYNQGLQEKKYVWREDLGRRFNYSPRLAVYKGIEEYCDELYLWYLEQPGTRKDHFKEMAHALEQAAPYFDEDYHYKEQKTFLSDRWKPYLDAWHIGYDKKQANIKRDASEIESYRFELSEIDEVWNNMKKGEIPEIASRIWYYSYPRKSAHRIAANAGVSIREFVFWMCVFKRHLNMVEKIQLGTHFCYRHNEENLSSAIEKRLKRVSLLSQVVATFIWCFSTSFAAAFMAFLPCGVLSSNSY